MDKKLILYTWNKNTGDVNVIHRDLKAEGDFDLNIDLESVRDLALKRSADNDLVRLFRITIEEIEQAEPINKERHWRKCNG